MKENFKPIVLITVKGGIAQVETQPEDVEVVIVDFDELEDSYTSDYAYQLLLELEPYLSDGDRTRVDLTEADIRNVIAENEMQED